MKSKTGNELISTFALFVWLKKYFIASVSQIASQSGPVVKTYCVMHHPLESELMKPDTIIWLNTAPMNKTIAFLRMVTPRKQSLKVHAPVFFWTLYNRNVQKMLLKIVPASWTALLLQAHRQDRTIYCSVMKRHFERNLHLHAFNCPWNLLVNRSWLPAITSGSLSLLIMPSCSWNA